MRCSGRSMDAKAFVLAAYKGLGADIRPLGIDHFLVEQDGTRQEIALSDEASAKGRAVLHEPGSAAFSRLVTRVASSGVHKVKDRIGDAEGALRDVVREWTG